MLFNRIREHVFDLLGDVTVDHLIRSGFLIHVFVLLRFNETEDFKRFVVAEIHDVLLDALVTTHLCSPIDRNIASHIKHLTWSRVPDPHVAARKYPHSNCIVSFKFHLVG